MAAMSTIYFLDFHRQKGWSHCVHAILHSQHEWGTLVPHRGGVMAIRVGLVVGPSMLHIHRSGPPQPLLEHGHAWKVIFLKNNGFMSLPIIGV